MKFDRKLYQIFGLNLGRPIRIKTAIYALVFGVLEVVLYFTPVLGNLINWLPFSILVAIPIGLAWLLADVGTEDRSPIKFFRSFILYQFRKMKGNSVFRGRKISKPQTRTFGNYFTFKEAESLGVLPVSNNNEEIEKAQQETTAYVKQLHEVKGKNKDVPINTNNQTTNKESEINNNENTFDDFAKSIFGSRKELPVVNNEKEDNALNIKNDLSEDKEIEYVEKEPSIEYKVNTIDIKEEKEEVHTPITRVERNKKHETKRKSKLTKNMNKPKEKIELKFKPIMAVVVIGVIIGALLLSLIQTIDFKEAFSKPIEDDEQTEKVEDENLIEGLRSASLQQYHDAIKYFDHVDFDSLNQEDKEVVLLSYLMAGQAEKSLVLDPDFDEVVASYFIAKEDYKSLKEMEDKSKVFQFEVAVNDENYEKIIELKDAVEMDTEREIIVANAFLELNKASEALSFAEERNNDELVYELESIIEEKEKQNDKKQKRKQK